MRNNDNNTTRQEQKAHEFASTTAHEAGAQHIPQSKAYLSRAKSGTLSQLRVLLVAGRAPLSGGNGLLENGARVVATNLVTARKLAFRARVPARYVQALTEPRELAVRMTLVLSAAGDGVRQKVSHHNEAHRGQHARGIASGLQQQSLFL